MSKNKQIVSNTAQVMGEEIVGGDIAPGDLISKAITSTEPIDLRELTDTQLDLLSASVDIETGNRAAARELAIMRMCNHEWEFAYTGRNGREKGDDYYRCTNNGCRAQKEVSGSREKIYFNGTLVSAS